MKTCKINLSYDMMGNTVYRAHVDSTIAHPTGKNITTVLDEIITKDHDDVVSFLIDRGVDQNELVFALEEMEKHGHNKAGFGIMGTFISSWYEGATH